MITATALEVQSRQIAVVLLRHIHSIAYENQRGLDGWGKINAGAKDCIIAKRERLSLAIADQGQAGILFVQLARFKFYWLIKTIDSGWLQAVFFELLNHIGLGFFQPCAACLAAFHVVVGKNLDV